MFFLMKFGLPYNDVMSMPITRRKRFVEMYGVRKDEMEDV